jgi:hypothetical protein
MQQQKLYVLFHFPSSLFRHRQGLKDIFIIGIKKNIYVNDSQNLAFPTSHFVIELLPFDYLSNQKQ